MEKRLKVLISENSIKFTKDLYTTFENLSIDIFSFPNDEIKLMDMINNIQPNAVIVQYFLLNTNAIELITSINRKHYIKHPAFIITCDEASPVLERQCILSGASYFMVKPFTPLELAHHTLNAVKNTKYFTNQDNFPAFLSKEANTKETNTEIQVTEILHQIGVPAHIKGYHYLRASIILSIENPKIINAVTKQLYPAVAEQFSTTSSRVERAIRHAIEVAWDRGDVDILNSYFGYTIHTSRGKPTNSEFIAMISDKLRLKIKSAS